MDPFGSSFQMPFAPQLKNPQFRCAETLARSPSNIISVEHCACYTVEIRPRWLDDDSTKYQSTLTHRSDMIQSVCVREARAKGFEHILTCPGNGIVSETYSSKSEN
jgi:hypothetical protein